MKLLLKLFIFYSLVSKSLAQAPQGIPYQAIARNASGVAIANTAVKVRFSIRDSIATGAIKYQETHSPTTSALGLFSVNVGMGTVVSGTFSGINWGKNAKFLQVELNTTGGTTFTDLGTTQMMSVPYALQTSAIKFKTSASGDTLYAGNGNYLIIPGLSALNPILNQPEAPVTDIDGNVYQTVRIGTQVWMKENLKVSKYRNGDPIGQVIDDYLWVLIWNIGNPTGQAAWCYYNNDASNNTSYGKLYNWYAVADPRGLCPNGWHVPSDSEWKTLESFLNMPEADINLIGSRGEMQNVGGKLKSVSSLWSSPNSGSTNESGFSALPGSHRRVDGSFILFGSNGFWWSGTNLSTSEAWSRHLDSGKGDSFRYNDYKANGFSVRCLKD
jgi:uncharacterized protein (TIGR02145 family)